MKSMWYNGVGAVEPEARVWDEGEKTAGRECGTHVIVWLVRTMTLYLTNVDIYATEGDKVSSQNRRSRQLLPVEDIRVRHVLLLHIHLIVFSFLGLYTLYGSSLYLGGENHMTSHLHLHEAEMWVCINGYIILFYLTTL